MTSKIFSMEVSSPGFFHWMQKNEPTTGHPSSAPEFLEESMVMGRLLAFSLATPEHRWRLVRRRQRALLYGSRSSDAHSVSRLYRRIGFQSPFVPSLDITNISAWSVTNDADIVHFAKFLFFSLYKNLSDALFQSIELGILEYGERIRGGLNQIANGFPMEEAWQAWKTETGVEVENEEKLFDLYFQRFQMISPEQRLVLSQKLDPNQEWFPFFQAGVLMRYEQTLRSRAQDWVLQQSEAIPRIPEERKKRIFLALENA